MKRGEKSPFEKRPTIAAGPAGEENKREVPVAQEKGARNIRTIRGRKGEKQIGHCRNRIRRQGIISGYTPQ